MRRGMYNNNPFNIPFCSEILWKGKVREDLNTDYNRQFEQFRSFDYGLRAGFLYIRHFMNTGCRTVNQLVGCLDPCPYSNSDYYLSYVLQRLNETCRYYVAGGYDSDEGVWFSSVDQDWTSDSVIYAFTEGFFAFCMAVLEYESGYYTTLDSLRNVANSFNLI